MQIANNTMKKLIIIQNDYPGTGKSTLALCLQRYLLIFLRKRGREKLV